jgi:hypothetical protein
MSTKAIRCRILQRESERDLFALRHPAMASDDDADDDGYDVELDSSDERQPGTGSATGRRSESTGKCKRPPLFISYLTWFVHLLLLGDA